jgi:hypothetical protein
MEKRGWDLNDAIDFIRSLEPKLAEQCEAHCGLIGGVLNKGTSEKDLDIVVYPHKKSFQGQWDISWIQGFLSSFLSAKLTDCTTAKSEGYRDAKKVSWVRIKEGPNAGRRIDFFFLS